MATAIAEPHAAQPDPLDVDWAIGPGSVSWDIFRNPCVFIVGILREAILLTLHLPFAGAATDHDGVHADPVKRFRTIARYAYAGTYGTKADAEHVSGFVRRRHNAIVGTEPVTGAHYQANADYELVLTQILLTSSWVAAYEEINGLMAPERRDQFLAEQKLGGALLGIEPQYLPSTWTELEAFLANARDHWAAGLQARAILKPFASGVYPPGSVIGELPPRRRAAVAFLVRILTDMALNTMRPDERVLLAIDRPLQLRSVRAVRASHRGLSAFLGSARGDAVFQKFLKPDVASIVSRAREAEARAGGPAVAARSFEVTDAAPFVATLVDHVHNLPPEHLIRR
jgi:uncharacterized protein (DUF2236 family)